jgi:hypothetical protein
VAGPANTGGWDAQGMCARCGKKVPYRRLTIEPATGAYTCGRKGCTDLYWTVLPLKPDPVPLDHPRPMESITTAPFSGNVEVELLPEN